MPECRRMGIYWRFYDSVENISTVIRGSLFIEMCSRIAREFSGALNGPRYWWDFLRWPVYIPVGWVFAPGVIRGANA